MANVFVVYGYTQAHLQAHGSEGEPTVMGFGKSQKTAVRDAMKNAAAKNVSVVLFHVRSSNAARVPVVDAAFQDQMDGLIAYNRDGRAVRVSVPEDE